jgi:hypothetical protein
MGNRPRSNRSQNRLNIAFRVPAGDYRPGMFKRAMEE